MVVLGEHVYGRPALPSPVHWEGARGRRSAPRQSRARFRSRPISRPGFRPSPRPPIRARHVHVHSGAVVHRHLPPSWRDCSRSSATQPSSVQSDTVATPKTPTPAGRPQTTAAVSTRQSRRRVRSPDGEESTPHDEEENVPRYQTRQSQSKRRRLGKTRASNDGDPDSSSRNVGLSVSSGNAGPSRSPYSVVQFAGMETPDSFPTMGTRKSARGRKAKVGTANTSARSLGKQPVNPDHELLTSDKENEGPSVYE
ncbi:unnamed protein product [Periconia digitata]|uniref:Uncharacterized protein n=1 Tax=Periconia digitata TaxID=1303443 RepID=A0A9W4XPV1_9PLEO|nr:unnamed protein product [Periconia digitata]